MRFAIVLVLLAACEKPLRPPPQTPSDPKSVSGCRSSPTELGGVRHRCASYEVIDNLLEASSIRSISVHLLKVAEHKQMSARTRPQDVQGADDAVTIVYAKDGQHAIDMLASRAVDAKQRIFQCHVSWFENAKTLEKRVENCAETIALLLQRPPPPGREISAECIEAANRLAKLPGRTEPPDHSEALNIEVRELAARCTPTIAACVRAAKTYVEAALCRD